MLIKDNVAIGIEWRFGPDWPGQRCGAKTRRGTACQRPANKKNGRCRLHGGASTGARTADRGYWSRLSACLTSVSIMKHVRLRKLKTDFSEELSLYSSSKSIKERLMDVSSRFLVINIILVR